MRGLTWCAVVAALLSAPTALAVKVPITQSTINYLNSKSSTSITRTVTLSAAARDSILCTSSVGGGTGAGDWNTPGVDTLGMGVSFWFEWNPTSSSTAPSITFYLYNNTVLNSADTLNTTAYDSILVQAGAHATSNDLPLDRAWKVVAVDGGGGGKLTYGVKTRPAWFRW